MPFNMKTLLILFITFCEAWSNQDENYPWIDNENAIQFTFASNDASEALAQISVDSSQLTSQTGVTYRIYNISELKQKVDYIRLNKTRILHLLQKPKIRLPAQETCYPTLGSHSTADKFFCVQESSGLIGGRAGYFTSYSNIGKVFAIKIFVRLPNSTVYRTNITLSVLPSCYPMTSLYRNVHSKCPSANKIYEHSGTWGNRSSLFLIFDIPGPVKFSSLFVNATLFSQQDITKENKCTLTLTFAFGMKVENRKVEYHSSPSTISGISEIPRVTGQSFNISLIPPIEMKYIYGQKAHVRISYNCTPLKWNVAYFSSPKAMVLHAVPRLKDCPDGTCMDYFIKWQDAYKALMRTGKIQCLSDELQQQAYLSPCLDLPLYLAAPYHFPFGKKIKLSCQGGYRFNKDKRWYHDGVLLPTKGDSLILSGEKFSQMGKYWCAIRDKHKSPSVNIVFEDITNSTISLVVINRNYTPELSDTKLPKSREILDPLEKEVQRVLALTSTYAKKIYSVKIRNWKTNVNVLFQILSHLPTNESIITYHQTLRRQLNESAKRMNFGTLKVSQLDLRVNHQMYCLPEVTGDASVKGIYTWPLTEKGKVIRRQCAYGPAQTYITRKCVGSSLYGATWTSYKDTDCLFNSTTTNKLNELSKVPITNDSAKSVAKELETLSEASESLTSQDTKFIGDTLANLVDSNMTTDSVISGVLETASNVMKASETALQDSQKNDKSLTSIVKSLAKLASNLEVPTKPGTPVVKVSSRVALQAVKVDQNQVKPITMSVNSISSEEFKKDDFTYGREVDTTKSSVSLQLPNTIFRDAHITGSMVRRVNFVVYKDGKLFQSSVSHAKRSKNAQTFAKVNSMVLSAEVFRAERVNLSTPLESTFRHQNFSLVPGLCVYWDFQAKGGLGAWSDKGCQTMGMKGSSTICRCNHLTNFAVLLDPYAGKKTGISSEHTKVLGIITYIGIGLSLAGLILTICTMTLFKRLRRTLPSKILIHLCTALALTLIAFLAGIERITPFWACKTSAALIHYFLLVTFLWMLVEAINLYLSFVKVLGTHVSKFLLKAGVLAWGIPAVVVSATLAARWNDYGTEKMCIITGYAAYGTVFGPILLILVVNFIIFVMVMKAVSTSSSKLTKDKKLDGKAHLRISFMCCTLVGLTWGFGAFAIADARIVFQYLFCIFNSLQGFFIFYFHVLRQADVRKHWINYLTGKERKYSTSYSSSKRGTASRWGLKKQTNHTALKQFGVSQPSTSPHSTESTSRKEFNNILFDDMNANMNEADKKI